MGGFFTHFLGSLADTAEEHRAKNEKQAQQDLAEQRSVYQHLLSSQDPKIRALALTGLFEPPKKSVFGKLKESPTYSQLLPILHRMEAGGAPPSQGEAPPLQPPPPPPLPGAAGMPDVPPMTGGGGRTGPASPAPGAPGSAFAAGDIGATPEVQEATSPAGSTPIPQAPLPPPPPPQGMAPSPIPQVPPPHEVVGNALRGKTPKEALALIAKLEGADTDALGMPAPPTSLDPLKNKLKMADAMGVPLEQVLPEIFPVGAKLQTAEEIAKLRVAAMLAKPRPGKIVYDTVGNKKVGRLVDSATGETIKANLSAQEIALGHAVINNPATGKDEFVQFSNMPGGGGGTGGGGTTRSASPEKLGGGPPPATGEPAAATAPPPPAPAAGGPSSPHFYTKQEVGTKLNTDEKQTLESVNTVRPIIEKAMKAIEDAGLTRSGNLGDWLSQRYSGALYSMGFNPGDEQSALIQNLAFARLPIVRTMARGRPSAYLLENIQEHMPNYKKDTPEQAYNKLKEWQSLLSDVEKGVASTPNTKEELRKRLESQAGGVSPKTAEDFLKKFQ